ncbi:collagenase [Amyelois transitella]|uniref:collagenase n=1 Tax=Amyelois transitella TaxID=680683 RepID=UPI00298FEF29|nr:collagenase [Amyelois transitella]
MAFWRICFLLAVAYSQVQADIVPADYVENVLERGSSRIVSGWEAHPGQFPHHAALRMVNSAGGVSGCGGSVVHRTWVISAAHCTAMQVTIVVRAGVVSLTTPQYIGETREWYNYPSFNDNTPQVVQPNDIAIIKLVRPVVYTDLLKPIRVQSSADAFRDYNSEIVQASGHGRLWTNGASPDILNWVYLRAISNSVCQMTYGANLITSNTICTQAFNVTSQSVCQGDSGGPLTHLDSEGRPVLIGVASFVAGGEWGCHSGLPAGFIRTGPFQSWLEQVSGINFENLEEEDETTLAPPTTTTTEPTTVEPTTITAAPTTTTTEAVTEVTTTPPVTEPTTTEPEEETEAPEPEDSSEEDSDEELSELMKKLEVKVKVRVRLNKYGKKKEHKHKHKVTL